MDIIISQTVGTAVVSETVTIATVSNTGAQGAPGDKGDKGDKGDTGATGPSGVVSVTSPITNTGTSTAANIGIQSASTSQSGAVQLTDSTSSTSTTTAATPNSVKSAYDLANAAIPSTLKGAANGVATLDSSGLVPTTQIPPIAISDTFIVASQSAMLALTAQVGDIAVRTDISKTFILQSVPASTLANWVQILTPPGVTSITASSPLTGGTITSTGSIGLDQTALSISASQVAGTAAVLNTANTFLTGQTIQTGNDANIGLAVKANSASQSANLLELQDNSGNANTYVDASGYMTTEFVTSNGATLADVTLSSLTPQTTSPITAYGSSGNVLFAFQAAASTPGDLARFQTSAGLVRTRIVGGGGIIAVEPVISNTNVTGTVSLDCSTGTTFTLTATGTNAVLNFTNLPTAGSVTLTLFITQGTGGSKTIAWASTQIAGSTKAPKWAGGTAPTLSTVAGAVDVVTLVVNNATTVYGFLSGKAFA